MTLLSGLNNEQNGVSGVFIENSAKASMYQNGGAYF